MAFGSGFVLASDQIGSIKYIENKAKRTTAPPLSNGCPDFLTGKIPKTSDLTVAADGTTAPCNAKTRNAKPLNVNVSSNQKWAEYNRAILESDFKRIIALFASCANLGDALCQYLLAEGVSEWLNRTDVEKNPKYDDEFVLKWQRKAYRSHRTLRLIAATYAVYFRNGFRGFPQDDELSECWLGLANTARGISHLKLRKIANHCEELTLRRYSIKP
jgi:hypothetical protein